MKEIRTTSHVAHILRTAVLFTFVTLAVAFAPKVFAACTQETTEVWGEPMGMEVRFTECNRGAFESWESPASPKFKLSIFTPHYGGSKYAAGTYRAIDLTKLPELVGHFRRYRRIVESGKYIPAGAIGQPVTQR